MFRKKPSNARKPQKLLPTTLKELGFMIGTEDKVITITDGKPFVFKRTSSQEQNERFYEAMLVGLSNEAVGRLEQMGFQKTFLPSTAAKDMPRTYYLRSTDYLDKDNIVFIIPNPTQPIALWSRRESFDEFELGTMLAIAKELISNDFGVIIVNPGERFWQDGKLTYTIDNRRPFEYVSGHEEPQLHVAKVMMDVNGNAKPTAKFYAIGDALSPEYILHAIKTDKLKIRLDAVAFTDPSFDLYMNNTEENTWLREHSLTITKVEHKGFHNKFHWGSKIKNPIFGVDVERGGQVCGHYRKQIVAYLKNPSMLKDAMNGAPKAGVGGGPVTEIEQLEDLAFGDSSTDASNVNSR